MAVLPIRTYPDPVLKKPAAPIEEITAEVCRLARDMAETMYQAPGQGLAAPQVGQSCRLIVLDISGRREDRQPRILVNPEILSAEGEIISPQEGCLSVLGYQADVKRAEKVTVAALDLEGRPVKIDAEGLLAIVLQHEIDHLEGKLFLDRLSPLKRQLYNRRLKKILKENKEQAA